MPVGFKYFVDGLLDGSLGVAGEESAGASFLRRDGTVWTTDKDGLIMGLLAVESMARTGHDPGEQYAALAAELGEPFYARIDFPATPEQKAALARLAPRDVRVTVLAGDPIRAVLTTASGDHRPIGGIKVVTDHGWFAARPSGTEAVLKIYAESFKDLAHLRRIQEEAYAIIQTAVATKPHARTAGAMVILAELAWICTPAPMPPACSNLAASRRRRSHIRERRATAASLEGTLLKDNQIERAMMATIEIRIRRLAQLFERAGSCAIARESAGS